MIGLGVGLGLHTRRGGGGFSPASLDPLLWLDFADTGTLGVSGSNLQSITSKSTGAQVFEQTSVSNQPTIVSTTGGTAMQTASEQYTYGPTVTGRFFLQVLRWDDTVWYTPFLGDTTEGPDFHGGQDPLILLSGTTSTAILNGSAWVNGTLVADISDMERPRTTSLVAFETTANVSFDSISRDRHFAARSRQGLTCDLYVLASPPSAENRAALFDYFMAKRGIT